MKKPLLILLAMPAMLPASAVLTVQFQVWNETCGNANGAIFATASGGVPPYSFAWSSGGASALVTGLTPGWYVLTVTDAMSQTLVDSAQVLGVPYLDWPDQQAVPQGGLFGCGGCNAGFHVPEDPDMIWWYNVNGFFSFSPAPFDVIPGAGYLFGPYCALDYPQLTITDSTGCTGTVSILPLFVSEGGPMTLLSTEGACLGANGSFSIDPLGGGFIMDQVDLTLYNAGWNAITTCQMCGWSPQVFSGLAAGDYHVVRVESYMDPYGMSCPPETLDVTVPDLGPSCGHLTGTLFLDHDQDCAQDVIDEAIPYRVMTITPGPQYVITGQDGSFDRNLAYGTYDLDQQAGADLIQLCPPAIPIPFTLSSLSPVVTLDIADSSAIPFDLGLFGAHGPTRLGFDAQFMLDARNLSGALSGPLTVTFTFDPVLTYVSASPAPSSIVGNVITWNLASLGAFGSEDVNITLNVPPLPGLMGTVVTCTGQVSNTVPELSLANNTAVLTSTITAAYDPNDKTVRTSSGQGSTQYFIGTDEWLDYTIRFQNTGTDTAFTVVIVDTLPAPLDPLTFVPGASSHPCSVAMSGDGIVTFTFDDIMLPDSNVNEPLSHGFVGFRIRPDQPELPGTTIANAADIFFDFNPPVHTNDAVVVLETSTGMRELATGRMSIFPNPVSDGLSIVLPANAPLPVRWLIRSLDGRIVDQGAFAGTTSVGTAGLAGGAYLLEVITTERAYTRVFQKVCIP